MLRAESPSELACWVRELDLYIRNRLEYSRYIETVKAKKIEDTSYENRK